MTRKHVQFVRRGQIVSLDGFSPTTTLLDYLRLTEKSKGTKEGCNEGDCGACTVALGRLKAGTLVYEPVNACIMLLGQIDGAELVTVEDLAQGDMLHPVQQALVEQHGSQCGFCTPGFVMALFTLYHAGIQPTRAEIATHLAGNLCRCTGYRPIMDAAVSVCRGQALDGWVAQAPFTIDLLRQLDDGKDVMVGDAQSFFAAPATADALAALVAEHRQATILAGATDVGLWITKQMRDLPQIIALGRVRYLQQISAEGNALWLGAGVTYAEALPALSRISPHLGQLVQRIGAAQVRSSATVCGNIANGSPIGDGPPALIALGARLHLRKGEALRSMALEDFFIAYGSQDRQPGELVWQVEIPQLARDEAFRCYKISKRRDQDISAVLAAFKFQLTGRTITAARIAYGGMAATPKRALLAEQALVGASLDDLSSWDAACAALAQDYQPISDMRASAAYRLEVALACLQRALLDVAQPAGDGGVRHAA